MNKGIAALLGFLAGGAIGFFAGKKALEQHYGQMAQEEIDSVKEAFRRQLKTEEKDAPQKREPKTEKPEETGSVPQKLNESTLRALKKDYRKYYPEAKAAPAEAKEEEGSKPRVISPMEFDTITGYEAISLTLYADGTVADDDDNPMSEEDIEETIGRESLNHFGEYERDSVFVRNDDMRTDYEILLDERSYEEALSSKPYRNPVK